MGRLIQIIRWLVSNPEAPGFLRDGAQRAQRLAFQVWNAQTLAVNRDQQRALAGEAQAQFDWAERFYEGRGLRQDYRQAAEWFHLAALQGHGRAQLNLALMIAAGRGRPHDWREAYYWAVLAERHGAPAAASARQRIAAHLEPEEAAGIERRAAEFQPASCSPGAPAAGPDQPPGEKP